jgi:hypothetical protein
MEERENMLRPEDAPKKRKRARGRKRKAGDGTGDSGASGELSGETSDDANRKQ